MTPAMVKTQIYFEEAELASLHAAARRSDRSVADLVREAVRRTWLRPESQGPVGLWSEEPKRSAHDHDSIYDEG